jgi:hypothetical protein
MRNNNRIKNKNIDARKYSAKLRTGLVSFEQIIVIAACLVLAVGVLASTGLISKNTLSSQEPEDQSWFSRINPFAYAIPKSPKHRLNKEYIYAGSHLLAVEDAGAAGSLPADLAIWRPSSGVWGVLGGSGSKRVSEGWGANGDIPAPGDYDGDNKVDFCVFRPSSNQWWILKSSDGGYFAVTFGTAGDQLVPADYDGDGKTDIAVFRSSDTHWYILRSSDGGLSVHPFGIGSDIPSPGDFDGDGKTDIAVWRNTDKKFYSRNTTDSRIQSVSFSSNSSAPVIGDYDGDGRSDYAIRNGADWIVRTSLDGVIQPAVSWQTAGDTAVPHDYDGDGKTDMAVWRSSNGNWLIRNSTTLSTSTQKWGGAGDVPVPANYHR